MLNCVLGKFSLDSQCHPLPHVNNNQKQTLSVNSVEPQMYLAVQ